MKKLILFAIFLSLLVVINASEYHLYNIKTQKQLSTTELVNELGKYDIVLFGEFHDNTPIHEAEATIYDLLNTTRPWTLSLEMFERDAQPYLDLYLQNKISEDSLLKSVNEWPNYKTDYRALIEKAKDKHNKVIAANVPRRIAARVSKEGLNSLSQLPTEDKSLVTQHAVILLNEYQKLFYQTLCDNMGMTYTDSLLTDPDLMRYYQAQCIKDDTMAESIYRCWKTSPETPIFHVNGDFHSANYLGTVEKLQLLSNHCLKIAVIKAYQYKGSFSNSILKQFTGTGDFLIIAPQKEDPTPVGQGMHNIKMK